MRIFPAVLVVLAVGCGTTTPPHVCVPGKSEACVGPGGCAGGQRCNAEGTALGECDCGTIDAGSGGGAGGGMGGGGGGGSLGGGTGGGGGADAGVDAGLPDAGPTSCDPTPTDGGSTGCASGQRCTWISLDATQPGRIGCVANGTVTAGGACVHGAATGVDDCVAGQICITGTCTRACALSDLNSCGSSGSCVAYSGLFANDPATPSSGACVPSCDPLTNVPCTSTQGCYLLTSPTSTTSVCAGAGTRVHGETIPGQAFANSCVPGAMPRAIFGSATFECGGLCAPAEVTMGNNVSFEGGMGVDCQTRWTAAAPSDATAGESCRFFWAREQLPGLSRYSNTLGFCFKHAAWQYDSNNDQTPDAPFPRCTAVTTADVLPPITLPAGTGNDALEFWCVHKPPMKLASPSQRMAPAYPQKLTNWR